MQPRSSLAKQVPSALPGQKGPAMQANIVGKAALTAITVALSLVLSACSGNAPGVASPSQLSGGTVIEKEARFEPIIKTSCPAYKPQNELVYVDESGSARGSAVLQTQRLQQIITAARKPAICGGLLRVVVFSRSVADTRPIVSETITPGSGTKISRILQADKVVGALVTPIKTSLANPGITGEGTDIVSALVDAGGTLSQLPAGESYQVLIVTDGENSVDPHLPRGLTVAKAAGLASALTVPNLRGASVSFTGIGLLGHGIAPSTSRVEALAAFWQAVCTRTHATCSTPTTNTIN